MSKICDSCGQELPDSALVCSLCGERLAASNITQNSHTTATPGQSVRAAPSGTSATTSTSSTSAPTSSVSIPSLQQLASSFSIGSIKSKLPQYVSKKPLAIFIIIVFAVVLISSHSSLIGTWEQEIDSGNPSLFPDYIELYKGGTGVIDEGYAIIWVAENGRFKMTYWGGTYTYDYKLSGNKLVLKNDDTIVTYDKK